MIHIDFKYQEKEEQINKSYSFESNLEHVCNSNFFSFSSPRKSVYSILNIRRIVYSSL